MGQTAQPFRTPPSTPPAEVWDSAVADYQQGRVLARAFQTQTGRVTASMTLTFMKAWGRAPLSETERIGVQAACVLLARGVEHPMLSATRLPVEPLGARMASPVPGVTITWMPHWSRPDEQVLMSITVER